MIDWRHEVWTWIARSAKDFSASTLDVDGFQQLSEQQRLDLAAMYVAKLGVNGDSQVSAQGMFALLRFPSYCLTCQRI